MPELWQALYGTGIGGETLPGMRDGLPMSADWDLEGISDRIGVARQHVPIVRQISILRPAFIITVHRDTHGRPSYHCFKAQEVFAAGTNLLSLPERGIDVATLRIIDDAGLVVLYVLWLWATISQLRKQLHYGDKLLCLVDETGSVWRYRKRRARLFTH